MGIKKTLIREASLYRVVAEFGAQSTEIPISICW